MMQKEQVAARMSLDARSIDMLFVIGKAIESKVQPDMPTIIDKLKFSPRDYDVAQVGLATRGMYETLYGAHPDFAGMPVFSLTPNGQTAYREVSDQIGHLYPALFEPKGQESSYVAQSADASLRRIA